MKAAALVVLCILAWAAFSNTVMPCGPYDRTAAVSTKEGAIAAAKRAWSSVYDKASWHAIFGPATIASFEPYSAFLNEGIWFVSGTSKDGKRGPVAYICASDGAASVHGT